MNAIVPSKRKLLELLGLVVLSVLFYLIYPHLDGVVLFALGFIWNWSASNELSFLNENRRYRMSTLKTVVNLQKMIVKPFNWAPSFVQKAVQVLPAGIFWSLVIYINDAAMPWWPTFLGSIAFELSQVRRKTRGAQT